MSAAIIDISVTGTDAALTFDMDGGVFGGSDPAQITMARSNSTFSDKRSFVGSITKHVE